MLCEEQLERESQPPHLKLELETGAGSASSEGAIDEVFQGLGHEISVCAGFLW